MTFVAVNFEQLGAWAVGLLPYAGFLLLVALLDALLSAAVAWKRGYFSIEWFPEFLKSLVLYFLAWISAEVLTFAPSFFGITIDGWEKVALEFAPKGVYGFIVVTKYVASIVNNIKYIQESPLPHDEEEEDVPA